MCKCARRTHERQSGVSPATGACITCVGRLWAHEMQPVGLMPLAAAALVLCLSVCLLSWGPTEGQEGRQLVSVVQHAT